MSVPKSSKSEIDNWRRVRGEMPIVVSISSNASDDSNLGHYHWLYRFLYEKQSENGVGCGKTIGPISENSDFITPLLKAKPRRRFDKTFGTILSFPWKKIFAEISRLMELGASHLQIYDGDLADFILGRILASKFPNLVVVYNFHWPLEWIELFEREALVALWARQCLTKIIRERPENLVLMAETDKFAGYLSKLVGEKIETYPIFSAFDPPSAIDWRLREFDVLCLPQRPTELRFVKSFLRLAKDSGLKTLVFLKQEVYERAISAKYCSPRDLGMVKIAPISREDYVTLLTRSRVVVLPYNKDYFLWGSSGKFNEAIASGAFPFAPSNSAVCFQSPGGPSAHGMSWNARKAVEQVVERLKRGFPSDLHPVTFETFRDSLPLLGQRRELTGKIPSPRLILNLLALAAYRPKSRSRFLGLAFLRRLRTNFVTLPAPQQGLMVKHFGAAINNSETGQ